MGDVSLIRVFLGFLNFFNFTRPLRDVAKLKKFQTPKKIWTWVGGSRAILEKKYKIGKP